MLLAMQLPLLYRQDVQINGNFGHWNADTVQDNLHTVQQLQQEFLSGVDRLLLCNGPWMDPDVNVGKLVASTIVICGRCLDHLETPEPHNG